MLRRFVSALAASALVLTVASGCSGEPEPVETTPGFATEEEAFAAAEETYRAYVDALNQVDLSDPSTFEPVFALTTGELNAGLREEFSQMHADGWTVSGLSEASVIEPVEFDDGTATIAVCLDVSDVDLVDESGASAVDADRVDVQSVLATLSSASDGSWSLSALEGRDGEPRCDG